ncbi:ParA family protein [Roseibium sediminis]|uniref:ParA family protein n=1 Tax=Roseibium sediminis TaxID=1775174 RepID=UPI00123D173B|nr:ParA family protein [Roseibium sediminis]
MPVISFANAKGGAGKTTAALLLATEIADRRKTVTLVDADPQKWLSKWAELPNVNPRISVVSVTSASSIIGQIQDASTTSDYVIVDLEGTENLLVANAISMSDLVIVPIQGSAMDARGGSKILALVRKLQKIVHHDIQHCVLLTRTTAVVTTRAMRAVQEHLAAIGVETLMTPLVERAAFRDLFDFGGSLSQLANHPVSNLENAKENATMYVAEVLGRLETVTSRNRWYQKQKAAS